MSVVVRERFWGDHLLLSVDMIMDPERHRAPIRPHPGAMADVCGPEIEAESPGFANRGVHGASVTGCGWRFRMDGPFMAIR